MSGRKRKFVSDDVSSCNTSITTGVAMTSVTVGGQDPGFISKTVGSSGHDQGMGMEKTVVFSSQFMTKTMVKKYRTGTHPKADESSSCLSTNKQDEPPKEVLDSKDVKSQPSRTIEDKKVTTHAFIDEMLNKLTLMKKTISDLSSLMEDFRRLDINPTCSSSPDSGSLGSSKISPVSHGLESKTEVKTEIRDSSTDVISQSVSALANKVMEIVVSSFSNLSITPGPHLTVTSGPHLTVTPGLHPTGRSGSNLQVASSLSAVSAPLTGAKSVGTDDQVITSGRVCHASNLSEEELIVLYGFM